MGHFRENVDLVRRYFEMWNTGDGSIADAVLAATYVDHSHPDLVGPAGARSLVPRFHAANPELRMRIEVLAAAPEFVAVRNTIVRAEDGAERPIAHEGFVLFRIESGKLVEQWTFDATPFALRGPGPSPRQVWQEANRRMRAKDVARYAEAFAENAVVERPSEPRLEGRAAIKSVLASASARAPDDDAVVVHETLDPEVIVVELDAERVQVVRVQSGRIALLREYGD